MINKVGFHTGPGGNRTGINEDYIQKLNSEGVQAVIKSVDDYGPIWELMQSSNTLNVGIFRLSHGGFDLPDYNKSPWGAAVEHWQNILFALPPEFDKRVWLEVINEPDKNRSEWLADFSKSIATMMLEDGYKPALFSWSSGEPEPTDWTAPKMASLLQWVGEQNGNVAIALHEYDYGRIGMENTYPNHIGRYTRLIDACRQMNISVPPILITEWGWSYNNIPPQEQCMTDIDWAGRLYGSETSIKGAGMWYLGGGSSWDNICDKVQKLIKPTGEWCVENSTPGTNPPPLPPPDSGQWQTVVDEWFEGYNDPQGSDWYDQDGVQQVRNGWVLAYQQGYNNEVPPEQQEENQYGLMEAIFRWDAFVPPEEWDTLLNEKGHAYKVFARQQAWNGAWQDTELLPAGTYRLTLEYFDDNYVDIVDGAKVPPPDPLSFEAMVGMGNATSWDDSGWITSMFQMDNVIQLTITTTEPMSPFYKLRGRWAILNLSAWVKRFHVELLTSIPEPPIEPPNNEGCARVPYNRTVIVPSSDISLNEYLDLARLAFNEKGTIGFSYDDAGIGCGLSSKTAILYGISEENEQTFLDWYNQYYPSTIVRFRSVPKKNFKFTHWPTEYKQITQGFGENPEDYYPLPGHEGVDMVAPHDSKIFAVANGTVSDMRDLGDNNHAYGRFVRVLHDDILHETTYAHLNSISVVLGQRVYGGQEIGRADNTGNSRGSHLHLTLKREGATTNGETEYPYDIINPEPFLEPLLGDDTGNVAFGVHCSATGNLASGEEDVINIVSPEIIKVLSSMPAHEVTQLATTHPNAVFVVRAFLSWGNRYITAQDFYHWTYADVERTIDAIGEGREVLLEIHNEPNLALEGCNFGQGGSWANGQEFATWFIDALNLFHVRFGDRVRYMYPGLSPGGNISGQRISNQTFFIDSINAWQMADALGVHAYWNEGFNLDSAIDIVSWYRNYTVKDIYVTEASNNSGSVDNVTKGQQYIEFWDKLKTIQDVKGLMYFVLSALDGTFDSEIWVKNGESNGIAEVVSGRGG